MKTPSTAATLLAAAVLAGCQSFDLLKANDPSVDEVEVYAAADEDELTPHLHHILEHPDEYERPALIAALAAVGEQGDATALPLVTQLAGDPDEEVRWHAAYALSAIGGEEARAVLGRLAADDPSELVRSFARSLEEDGGA